MSSRLSRRSFYRQSVATATGVFTGKLHDTLEQLHLIWDEAGMTDELRGARVDAFYKHLGDLLDDMLTSEKNMVEELRTAVVKYSKEIETLCSELDLISELTPINKLELIARVDALKHEKRRLESLKKERLSRLRQLQPQDQQLCDKLDTVPFVIFRPVPSETDLLDLAQHVAQMERLLGSRRADFEEAKVELERILKRMGKQPTDQLAITVLKHEDRFVFSDANMESLKFLLDETREEYKMYVSEFRTRFDAVESEVVLWRSKCLLNNEHSRALPPFDEDSISESLLETYQTELRRLKAYYEERQDVLGRVDEWQTLWAEKMEHDRKEKDPTRFHNRACNLDRELKRRRHVEHVLLPQARKAVQEALSRWSLAHPDSPILIKHSDPIVYIDLTMREYDESRELEKEQKHEQKKRQLLVESRFGAVQSSPVRRTPGQSVQGSILKRVRTPVSARSPVKTLQQLQMMSPAAKRSPRAVVTTSSPMKRPLPNADPLCSVNSYDHFTLGIHGKAASDGSDNPAHSSFVSQRPNSPRKLF